MQWNKPGSISDPKIRGVANEGSRTAGKSWPGLRLPAFPCSDFLHFKSSHKVTKGKEKENHCQCFLFSNFHLGKVFFFYKDFLCKNVFVQRCFCVKIFLYKDVFVQRLFCAKMVLCKDVSSCSKFGCKCCEEIPACQQSAAAAEILLFVLIREIQLT